MTAEDLAKTAISHVVANFTPETPTTLWIASPKDASIERLSTGSESFDDLLTAELPALLALHGANMFAFARWNNRGQESFVDIEVLSVNFHAAYILPATSGCIVDRALRSGILSLSPKQTHLLRALLRRSAAYAS